MVRGDLGQSRECWLGAWESWRWGEMGRRQESWVGFG